MPRLCSLSRLSLAVLLLAALGSVAWAKPKVAILGLEASNSGIVEPKDAANAAKLTEELRAIPRSGVSKYELAPNSNRELQDEKLMGNCDTEKPACMAPIGAGLGADYLLYGNIVKAAEKGKDGYKVSLKLLNVKAKTLEDPHETFVPLTALTGGNGAREWAQKAYAKLTGDKPPAPERPAEAGPGKLVVKGNVKSGDVFVGSTKKGTLEGGTVTLTLPEGTHQLAIESPGRRRYEATVTVTGGQTKTVDAMLEEVMGPTTPIPPPPGKSSRTALKITGYSLAGVAAVAGGYVAYATLGPIHTYESRQTQPLDANNMEHPTTSEDCTGDPVLRDPSKGDANAQFDKACTANKWRNIMGVVGIATGVIAAGTLYFAYRSEGKGTEMQAMGRRTRRQLTVTPVISPTGGGATVRFDW